MLSNPVRSFLAGLALAALALAAWLVIQPVDARGLTSVLLRFVHVLSAMVWVGLIFFVNFIQLKALEEADDVSRGAISRWIVPRVAMAFRHASHLTVLSGALLLVATGYVLGELPFSSTSTLPLARTAMLAFGALGGLIMWSIVNFVIWPSLKVALVQTASDAAKAQARSTVRRYARLNLVLAIPVIFAMIAAAHLA
jgi:uncharacterized membrane protein